MICLYFKGCPKAPGKDGTNRRLKPTNRIERISSESTASASGSDSADNVGDMKDDEETAMEVNEGAAANAVDDLQIICNGQNSDKGQDDTLIGDVIAS